MARHGQQQRADRLPLQRTRPWRPRCSRMTKSWPAFAGVNARQAASAHPLPASRSHGCHDCTVGSLWWGRLDAGMPRSARHSNPALLADPAHMPAAILHPEPPKLAPIQNRSQPRYAKPQSEEIRTCPHCTDSEPYGPRRQCTQRLTTHELTHPSQQCAPHAT